MEWQGGLLVKIISTVAAVLCGITGWLIMTGRHDRYYKAWVRDPFYKKWLSPPHDGPPESQTQCRMIVGRCRPTASKTLRRALLSRLSRSSRLSLDTTDLTTPAGRLRWRVACRWAKE